MAVSKITEAALKQLQTDSELRDTEQTGFYARKQKRKITFYYSFISPIDGKRKYITLGAYGNLTVSLAREAAKKAAGEVALGVDPQEKKLERRESAATATQRTFRHFLEGQFKKVVSGKMWDDTERSLRLHFKGWLDREMNSITKTEVQEWQQNYPGAPSGANRQLDNVRGLLTKAVDAKVIAQHPLRKIPNLRIDKQRKLDALTKAEEQRLLTALDNREERRRAERDRFISWHHTRNTDKNCPEPHGSFTDHLKPILLLALHTGMRQGELFNLWAEDVDFESGTLTVVGLDPDSGRRSKSAQTRVIPLNKVATATLRAWFEQTKPESFVFQGKNGGRLDNIKSALTSLFAEARIQKKGKKLHALRHTFGTRLARKRVDLITIKELMGHASLETTQKYLHTDDEHKAKAVQLLDD